MNLLKLRTVRRSNFAFPILMKSSSSSEQILKSKLIRFLYFFIYSISYFILIYPILTNLYLNLEPQLPFQSINLFFFVSLQLKLLPCSIKFLDHNQYAPQPYNICHLFFLLSDYHFALWMSILYNLSKINPDLCRRRKPST